MKTRSTAFQLENELPWETPGPGLRRQIMAYDGQLMIVKVHFDKGAIGVTHDHYHSQGTYVNSGRFEVTVGNETKVLGPGDGFYIAPDEPHGAVCLEEGVLIDVFSPHRADFLSK